ncbi:lipoprotein-related protein [Isoalcanivorax pacificus W11-5]|uniref:Lipoprotein-related protein n=1 Tax=Isoalcanivorax pacificus W11-5 TaxID=391936 RepID=A0A0B4XP10_9GAMM|nr:YbaY family lipoprotein [Isoalcanivorax pacificus]AJD50099.1 lipoprotein-related protein [Isoalcanivorax pacificus W11-5]
MDVSHRLPRTLTLALLASLLTLAGCDKPEDKKAATEPPPATAQEAEVSGTLIYREREALPQDARIHVQLLDVSLMDVPATVLSEKTFSSDGRQVPIPFTLTFKPAGIDARHHYAVRGEIRDADGQLRWTTMQQHRVDLSAGSPPPVELMLGKVTSGEERVPAEEVLEE